MIGRRFQYLIESCAHHIYTLIRYFALYFLAQIGSRDRGAPVEQRTVQFHHASLLTDHTSNGAMPDAPVRSDDALLQRRQAHSTDLSALLAELTRVADMSE